MFNVGGPEIMVVILVALVVLGPEQLPKAMRTFGNVMAQIRKVSNGFQDEMRNAMNTLDVTAAAKSGSTSSSSSAGSTPVPELTETVARNDAAPTTTTSTHAPMVDPVSDRPGISPADRAAG